jgi:8-oxo-dGTP pyrophosphatase MutT (NUDIX family)
MHLDNISESLKKRLSLPLPGDLAHALLRAIPVGDITPEFDHKLPPRPGGVLILLYQEGREIKFPLIKRQEYLGAHSGQVSLPGGKAEPGEDSVMAALREGEEEIGINREEPNVLGTLSNFVVIPSNFMITPVVATLGNKPVFKPDSYEVAKILFCSLEDLIKEDAIQQREILAGGKFRMMAPHFAIEGEIVWGATAMMLNEFRSILLDII